MIPHPREINPLLIAGIDPGGRFTALSVLREENTVEQSFSIIYSGTFKRPDTVAPINFVVELAQEISNTLAGIQNENPESTLLIGIEGVNAPKGFVGGKRASLNPAGIIMTGIIAGGLRVTFPEAAIINPAGNGSSDLDTYPEDLRGRRPKNLPGNIAGNRNHERSAYDVAVKTAQHFEGQTGRLI